MTTKQYWHTPLCGNLGQECKRSKILHRNIITPAMELSLLCPQFQRQLVHPQATSNSPIPTTHWPTPQSARGWSTHPSPSLVKSPISIIGQLTLLHHWSTHHSIIGQLTHLHHWSTHPSPSLINSPFSIVGQLTHLHCWSTHPFPSLVRTLSNLTGSSVLSSSATLVVSTAWKATTAETEPNSCVSVTSTQSWRRKIPPLWDRHGPESH